MGFLIRVSYLVIVVVALYWLGEFISIPFLPNIEFKYILPLFSLVFFDYYLNGLSRFFLKIQVLNKVPIENDQGQMKRLNAKFKLSYSGSKDLHFRLKDVSVKNENVSPTVVYKGTPYDVPGNFECTLSKTKSAESFKVECDITPPSSYVKGILGFRFSYFVMEVHYTVSYSKEGIKRIRFLKFHKEG